VSDTLRTERLTLVPLEAGFVHVHDRNECLAAQEHWAEHGFGSWAILVRAGTFVGAVDVRQTRDEVEVGWSILAAHQGRGYATEAVRAALLDFWTRSGIDHVVAHIRPESTASQRVARKLGFQERADGIFELHV
jgi:RimJ/RimL family protein N-acetyltransferase